MRRFSQTFLTIMGILFLGVMISIPNKAMNSLVSEYIISTRTETEQLSVPNEKVNEVREEAIEAIQNLAVEHKEMTIHTADIIAEVESALSEFEIKENAKEEKIAYKSQGSIVVQGIGKMQQATSTTTEEVLQGDVDGNGVVNSDDAIRVLYYVLDSEQYAVNQECDFDGDGDVDSNDAIYLLYYTIAPDKYPLASPYKGDISWYNDNDNTFVLRTVDQFYGFAYLVNSGIDFATKTVKLGNDILMNMGNASDWATVAPENEWEPIGTSKAPFAGIFDGQGHSISGIYVNRSENNSGLFGVAATDSCVKNFRLINSYIYAYNEDSTVCGTGSVVAELRGELNNVYSNAIVSSEGIQSGGLVGRAYGLNNTSVTIKNCWFDGQVELFGTSPRFAGGIAGVAIEGDVIFVNCCNSGMISSQSSGIAYAGGFFGSNLDTNSICISDCLNVGVITAAANVNVGSLVGKIAGSPSTFNNVYVLDCKWTIFGDWKVSSNLGANVTVMNQSDLTGEQAYHSTQLDFDNYWVARKDKYPTLKSFANSSEVLDLSGIMRVDTSWFNKAEGTTTDPYIISTVGELYGFAQLVNSGTTFAEKTVKLDSDIVVNPGNAQNWSLESPEYTWTPIGTQENPFKGTFDGQGHTIKGIYVETDQSNAGLFGYANACQIKRFTLTNSMFISSAKTANMGSILGCGDATLESVYSDAILESTGTVVGGLIGRANHIQGTNVMMGECWFDGEINATGTSAFQTGGFIGSLMYGELIIDNCLFTGNILANYAGGSATMNLMVGGMIGRDMNSNAITIKDSLSAGTIEIPALGKANAVGSVLGYLRSKLNVENVYAVNECYSNAIGTTNTSAITSGTPVVLSLENITGNNAAINMQLDFENYWKVRENNIPGLKKFCW